jgi:hypothetical protein
MVFVADFYTVRSIKTMDEVRQFWGDDPHPSEDNWMLGSTSGVHGSYITLDRVEECLRRTCDCFEDSTTQHRQVTFTVLICQPRLVKMVYGDVPVTLDDLPYLSLIIRRSLTAILASQDGNQGQ